MLSGRIAELGEQILSIGARCEELEAKIEECTQELTGRRGELEQTEAETAELGTQYEGAHEDYRIGELAITELQAQLEDAKAGTIDLLRRTAQLHNEMHGLDVRKENLHGQQGRLFSRPRKYSRNVSKS